MQVYQKIHWIKSERNKEGNLQTDFIKGVEKSIDL